MVPVTNMKYGLDAAQLITLLVPIFYFKLCICICLCVLSQAPQAVPVEKNSAMWRNFRLNAEIVPFKRGENLSHGEISPHEKCGDKSVKWRINNVFNFLCFVAFYTVLLQNLSFMRFTLFCRDSCALAWRKIEQKILPVEKKGQI